MALPPKVIVTRKLPDAVEERLAAAFTVALNPTTRPSHRRRLAAALRRPTASSAPSPIRRRRTDRRGRRARILANFAVGVNNIDLAAAKAAGLVVTNTPGVLTDATADLAMALILAATRRMSETEAILRRGKWDGFRPTGFLGMGLQGKTLGIVGMGRIGQATARRAALGFGMRVVYFNRSPVGPFDFPGRAPPDHRGGDGRGGRRLAAPAGRRRQPRAHLGGADGAMKPTAYLVNTARGDILDEAALAEALRERRIAGAGLDVYADEPHVPPALIALPNVTLLPHIGSATLETRTAMGMLAIDNLLAHFAGEPLPSRVV